MIIHDDQLGSLWTDIRNKLTAKVQDKAVDAFQRKGLQVFIKTDIGKEVKVYDSASINKENSGDSFIKYGVKVIDKNGNIVGEYGQYPKTDMIKTGLLYGSGLLAAWTIFKGVKNFY